MTPFEIHIDKASRTVAIRFKPGGVIALADSITCFMRALTPLMDQPSVKEHAQGTAIATEFAGLLVQAHAVLREQAEGPAAWFSQELGVPFTESPQVGKAFVPEEHQDALKMMIKQIETTLKKGSRGDLN